MADYTKCKYTISELKYMLFYKKLCPNCGGRLVKVHKVVTTDSSIFNNQSKQWNGMDTDVHYAVYECNKCGHKITLGNKALSRPLNDSEDTN